MRFIEPVTIWRSGTPDLSGTPTWSAPETVQGRWQDVEQMFLTASGQQSVSRAVVYIPFAAKVGDYFFRGTSAASSPPAGAHEARAFRHIRSVLGDKEEFRVIL